MLVASALALRITRFTRPRRSMPYRIFHRRPGGKLCVGCRTAQVSALTRSTNLAFQSGVVRVWRESLHTVCHLGGTNHSLPLARAWECEAGEALIQSVGNARQQRRCRVKHKTGWGPSGKHKSWRC